MNIDDLELAYNEGTRIVLGVGEDEIGLEAEGYIVEGRFPFDTEFKGAWVRTCWTPELSWARLIRAGIAISMTNDALEDDVREWLQDKRDGESCPTTSTIN